MSIERIEHEIGAASPTPRLAIVSERIADTSQAQLEILIKGIVDTVVEDIAPAYRSPFVRNAAAHAARLAFGTDLKATPIPPAPETATAQIERPTKKSPVWDGPAGDFAD